MTHATWKGRVTQESFQTDASSLALTANHISSAKPPTNHRAAKKYQFETPSQWKIKDFVIFEIFFNLVTNLVNRNLVTETYRQIDEKMDLAIFGQIPWESFLVKYKSGRRLPYRHAVQWKSQPCHQFELFSHLCCHHPRWHHRQRHFELEWCERIFPCQHSTVWWNRNRFSSCRLGPINVIFSVNDRTSDSNLPSNVALHMG